MSHAYHRMFRAHTGYRWWKPLVAIAIGFALYFGFSLVWQQGLVLIVEAVGGRQAGVDLVDAAQRNPQDSSNPLVMLLTLGALATMVPAVIIAVRLAGLGGWGQLTSVVGRLRWRWLARCIVPGAVFIGVSIGLNVLTSSIWPEQGAVTAPGTATPPAALFASIVIILLFVPLQAAGEEFAFRGLAMQSLGSWVRWPVVAIVVPVVGFAFAHSYNVWGRLDVSALGIAFAYLTWRTGGLEAGIVAHVINNVVVFIIAAPVVQVSQNDGSPIGAGITVVSAGVYVLLVEWQARRHSPQRTGGGPVENASAMSDDPRRLAR